MARNDDDHSDAECTVDDLFQLLVHAGDKHPAVARAEILEHLQLDQLQVDLHIRGGARKTHPRQTTEEELRAGAPTNFYETVPPEGITQRVSFQAWGRLLDLSINGKQLVVEPGCALDYPWDAYSFAIANWSLVAELWPSRPTPSVSPPVEPTVDPLVEPEPKVKPTSPTVSEPLPVLEPIAEPARAEPEPVVQPTIEPEPMSEPLAAPKKGRRPGGGAKPKLTEHQAVELQQALRQEIMREPATGKHDAALAWLRDSAVPKIKMKDGSKFTVSNSTLYRHVLRPVLGQQ
jgi:hypothetical protein